MLDFSLNKEQKEAVEYTEGPLLILAGAGAGKTKTITQRIIHLIKNGVEPQEILAVTFTNKAANEMKDRVKDELAKEKSLNFPISLKETPHISTFHALGVKIIRENSEKLSLKKSFTIYDRNDSIKSIKRAIQEAGFDPKQMEPKKILSIISKQKGDGLESEFFGENIVGNFLEEATADIWKIYEKILKSEDALDFDDLLLKTKKLLKENADVKKTYQDRWKYIHIDEYQDTNKIQDEIATLLAEKGKNICVVGDIDQNIFSWRGADIGNILHFEKIYPELKTIFLEQNYRSSKNIIEASNKIIEKNKKRIEKKMSSNAEVGEKIGFFIAENEKEEAFLITEQVRELLKRGTKPNEIAILYRTNFQSRVLEEAFIESEIQYQLLGTKFFERKEIKDALAFVRLALNPGSVLDLKRTTDALPFGIGKTSLAKIIEGNEDKLNPNLRKKVDNFKKLLKNIQKTIKTSSPSVSIRYIIKEAGFLNKYSGKDEDSVERLQNLKELVSVAKKYDTEEPEEGAQKLLENATLSADQDNLKEKERSVKLMTVHASKGLEFDFVFVCGMEQDLFPHQEMSAGNSTLQAQKDEEEERRLFYVALTRARKKVFLSYALTRSIYGSKQVNIPSEFINDIEEYLETEGSDGKNIIF